MHAKRTLRLCVMRDLDRRCLRWVTIPLFYWVGRTFPPPNPLMPTEDQGSLPDPWLGGKGIRPELAHDLRVLATMNALAETMSERPREAAHKFLRTQIEGLELPDDLHVAFDDGVEPGVNRL